MPQKNRTRARRFPVGREYSFPWYLTWLRWLRSFLVWCWVGGLGVFTIGFVLDVALVDRNLLRIDHVKQLEDFIDTYMLLGFFVGGCLGLISWLLVRDLHRYLVARQLDVLSASGQAYLGHPAPWQLASYQPEPFRRSKQVTYVAAGFSALAVFWTATVDDGEFLGPTIVALAVSVLVILLLSRAKGRTIPQPEWRVPPRYYEPHRGGDDGGAGRLIKINSWSAAVMMGGIIATFISVFLAFSGVALITICNEDQTRCRTLEVDGFIAWVVDALTAVGTGLFIACFLVTLISCVVLATTSVAVRRVAVRVLEDSRGTRPAWLLVHAVLNAGAPLASLAYLMRVLVILGLPAAWTMTLTGTDILPVSGQQLGSVFAIMIGLDAICWMAGRRGAAEDRHVLIDRWPPHEPSREEAEEQEHNPWAEEEKESAAPED